MIIILYLNPIFFIIMYYVVYILKIYWTWPEFTHFYYLTHYTWSKCTIFDLNWTLGIFNVHITLYLLINLFEELFFSYTELNPNHIILQLVIRSIIEEWKRIGLLSMALLQSVLDRFIYWKTVHTVCMIKITF